MCDVVVIKLALAADSLAFDDDPVSAVSIGDEGMPILALDDGVESAYAVIGQHKVVGRTTTDSNKRLGQFEHAALAVGRRDDDAAHSFIVGLVLDRQPFSALRPHAQWFA